MIKVVRVYSDLSKTMLELVNVITSQLGVEETQAKGGAGLLFQLAQDQLKGDQFSQVAQFVPGIGDMISAAPKAGGMAGALGGLASAMGAPGAVGNIAALAGGFSKLGLNPAMVNQFVPIILSYVKGKGGDNATQLLAQVFK